MVYPVAIVASSVAWLGNFCIGMAKEHKNAAPQKASATAKVALRTIHVCRQDAREHIRPEHILQL